MTATLWGDFLTARRNLAQQTLIGICVGIFISLSIGNIYAVIPVLTITTALTLMFVLLSLDEQNGWQGLRAACPLTRADVIGGRLALLSITCVTTIAVGVTICAGEAASAPILATMLPIDPEGFAFDATLVTLSATLALLIVALFVAVILPLAARFGMTRGLSLLPLLLLVVAGVAILIGNSFGIGDKVLPALENLFANHLWSACAMTFALAVILYVAGGILAARFYEHREF